MLVPERVLGGHNIDLIESLTRRLGAIVKYLGRMSGDHQLAWCWAPEEKASPVNLQGFASHSRIICTSNFVGSVQDCPLAFHSRRSQPEFSSDHTEFGFAPEAP